jgi:ABC-2 type transport system permease protein
VCLLSFFMYFQIFFITGLFSFWSSSPGSYIRSGVGQIMGLFGGKWIPLALFPTAFLGLTNVLPFKYLFNYPVMIFQGKVPGSQLAQMLVIQTVWLMAFMFLGKLLWEKGIKMYEAYGK